MIQTAVLQTAADRVSDHYDKHPEVPIEWEVPEGVLPLSAALPPEQAPDQADQADTKDPSATADSTPPMSDEELARAIDAHNADRLASRPPDDPPNGYAFYRRSHRDSASPTHLLLPETQAIRLSKADAEQTQRFLDLIKQRREAREAAEQLESSGDGDANRRGNSTSDVRAPIRSLLSEKVGDIDPKTDLDDLVDPVPHADYDPAQQMPVFRYAQLKELILNARSATPDRDWHTRLSNLFKQLKATGPLRQITQFTTMDALDELQESCPNFADVVQTIRNRVILAQVTGRFHIPPVLLLGPPGVGKTRFAQCLARLLATDFFRFSMDSGTTGATLLGSDAHWGNTQQGLLTQTLTTGKAANPVFVLDEVDKANDSDERYSAINALHSLLEPETAANLRDLSTRLVIDASRVIWIATANRQDRIPDSIQSRFKVFHIGMAVGDQTLKVARSVVESVLRHNGLTDFEIPSEQILRTIALQPARAVYQAVEDAVCEAIAKQRRHLLPEDFKPLQALATLKANKATAKSAKPRMALTLVRAEMSIVDGDGDSQDSQDSDPDDTDEPETGNGSGKRWLH